MPLNIPEPLTPIVNKPPEPIVPAFHVRAPELPCTATGPVPRRLPERVKPCVNCDAWASSSELETAIERFAIRLFATALLPEIEIVPVPAGITTASEMVGGRFAPSQFVPVNQFRSPPPPSQVITVEPGQPVPEQLMMLLPVMLPAPLTLAAVMLRFEPLVESGALMVRAPEVSIVVA